MKEQEQRFLKANLAAVFFVAVIGLVGMAVPFLLFFVYLIYKGGIVLVLETWNGLPDTNQYTKLLDELFVPIAFMGLIVGMAVAVILWKYLFVKSGYLDSHTLERITENMAPTERMERLRKVIGFLFLVPFLMWINWHVYQRPIEDRWGLLVTLPLLFYFLYLAYKEYKEYRSGKQCGSATLLKEVIVGGQRAAFGAFFPLIGVAILFAIGAFMRARLPQAALNK